MQPLDMWMRLDVPLLLLLLQPAAAGHKYICMWNNRSVGHFQQEWLQYVSLLPPETSHNWHYTLLPEKVFKPVPAIETTTN